MPTLILLAVLCVVAATIQHGWRMGLAYLSLIGVATLSAIFLRLAYELWLIECGRRKNRDQ